MSTATLSRKCTDTAVGWFHCQSFTDAKKSYDVYLDAEDRNTCTCIAFAIKRNKVASLNGITADEAMDLDECTCKHILALKSDRSGCGWTSDSKEKHEYETVCPRCFADTEVYDTRDPETVDLDELMADFLALKKKLKKARS